MTSEVLPQAVLAGVVATWGRGRIFNILALSSPVTITLEGKSVQGGQTNVRKFVNIPAGAKFTAPRGEEWTFLRLLSSVNQNVTLFVGDDDMSFNNAVTVTGTAVVAINPSSSVNSPVQSVLGGNALDATGVPANLARRRVTVYNLAASAGPIRVSDTGATTRGFEVAPGTFAEIDTTAALGIRTDTAAGATWGYFEES